MSHAVTPADCRYMSWVLAMLLPAAACKEPVTPASQTQSPVVAPLPSDEPSPPAPDRNAVRPVADSETASPDDDSSVDPSLSPAEGEGEDETEAATVDPMDDGPPPSKAHRRIMGTWVEVASAEYAALLVIAGMVARGTPPSAKEIKQHGLTKAQVAEIKQLIADPAGKADMVEFANQPMSSLIFTAKRFGISPMGAEPVWVGYDVKQKSARSLEVTLLYSSGERTVLKYTVANSTTIDGPFGDGGPKLRFVRMPARTSKK